MISDVDKWHDCREYPLVVAIVVSAIALKYIVLFFFFSLSLDKVGTNSSYAYKLIKTN